MERTPTGLTDRLQNALAKLVANQTGSSERKAIATAIRDGEIALDVDGVLIGGNVSNAVVINLQGDGAAQALADILRELLPPRLSSLPAAVPDFQGRTREIALLVDALKAGCTGMISSIGGMGGVGKTALAVKVGHRVAARFPDGQVWIDMRGSRPERAPAQHAPVEHAMGRIIHAFEPIARLPANPQDLLALYRSTLTGKRCLLVLDDVHDSDRVDEILPAPPAAALITSRRRLSFPGAFALDLEVFSMPEAIALLEDILRRHGRAADTATLEQLAAACGFLPLALRAAAAFIGTRPDWSLSEYLAKLVDSQGRLTQLSRGENEQLDVRAVLLLSYSQLLHERAALAARWRALSIFPGSFERQAVAAVWECAVDEAHENLSELLRRAMLQFDPQSGRYQLHDLMRDLAREIRDE